MGKRKSRDLDRVRCIKSDKKKKIVRDNNIKESWREYFNKLLSEDSIGALGSRENTLLSRHTFYHIIRVAEVKKALARIKIVKSNFQKNDSKEYEARSHSNKALEMVMRNWIGLVN